MARKEGFSNPGAVSLLDPDEAMNPAGSFLSGDIRGHLDLEIAVPVIETHKSGNRLFPTTLRELFTDSNPQGLLDFTVEKGPVSFNDQAGQKCLFNKVISDHHASIFNPSRNPDIGELSGLGKK